MDVIEAIHTRRTTKSYTSQPAPREAIEKILEAAVWAPNHRHTEPWEFIVVQGEALEQLAQHRKQLTLDFGLERGTPKERLDAQVEDAYKKTLAAPVTVVVTVAMHEDPDIREEDNFATAVAIQNMMLAAHSMGLASFWSTNALRNYEPTREYLGIPENRRIIGLVQFGHPAATKQEKRVPASERTRWVGAESKVGATV